MKMFFWRGMNACVQSAMERKASSFIYNNHGLSVSCHSARYCYAQTLLYTSLQKFWGWIVKVELRQMISVEESSLMSSEWLVWLPRVTSVCSRGLPFICRLGGTTWLSICRWGTQIGAPKCQVASPELPWTLLSATLIRLPFSPKSQRSVPSHCLVSPLFSIHTRRANVFAYAKWLSVYMQYGNISH